MPGHDITALPIEWTRGDTAAIDELLPLVHGELRRLAKRQMAGERPGHVVQPRRSSTRSISSSSISGGSSGRTAPTSDEALAAFGKEYERKAQVVELRFFGGCERRRDRRSPECFA
jgi:hypothetical protein